MNIVIPMAGHSRRFKEAGYTTPKALIEIDGAPMISHVVDMFSQNEQFTFILNQDQVAENPDICEKLSALVSRANIVVIPCHEKGPAYSCLQAANIFASPDEEVIVAYCDFIVDWDYERFVRFARNYDAAVSTFRGFHPASFGTTHYAYLRTEGEKMVELREKKSFTNDRTQEHASTGIYYFKSSSMFKKYAELTLNELPNLPMKEAYVSLLYNFMVKDGLEVGVQDVERFICWGTPEDLEQYLFWLKYFKRLKGEPVVQPNNTQTNLIPMAGKGTRFKEAGYRVIKPLIQVHGKPMAVTACESFPDASDWIYLVRDTELKKHPIERALKQFTPNCKIISVDHDTSGQAATCLLAEEQLTPEKPLFIASCDYQTIYNTEAWKKIIDDPTVDGVVWTTQLKNSLAKNPNSFAYCVTQADGKTIEKIVEKKTISETPYLDPMVVGSFWFRKTSSFLYAAKEMIRQGITVNGEHYVGTSINTLLEKGANFIVFEIDQWISFGDPFELQVFEYWQDHFEHRLK